jgi:glucosyl-dolichyl phosphate glucuronosyltransferase
MGVRPTGLDRSTERKSILSPSVSVIICAHTEDRWSDLVDAVGSVESQTFPAYEIIVVVDHNPDLLDRVRRNLPSVVAVENVENRGASGSKNTGASVAQGAIVAFLDDDAMAEPDWLECLLPPFQDPRTIAVGGSITPSWPERRPGWFPTEFDWVVGCTYRGMPEQTSPVRNLIGANMAFRRETFERVRLYHGIGHIRGRPFGGSDPDFCIRVSQNWPGKVLIYEPRARVFHQVSRSRTTWTYFLLRCFNEGLSKSLLTSRVGSKEGLSSERAYTLRTLPRGCAQGLADTALRADFRGIYCSAAIILGFLVTVAGYLVGKASQWVPARGRMTRSDANR